jgi:catechol 2,3-dioxygenase-like lactoylglutathione lyase family enzyme
MITGVDHVQITIPPGAEEAARAFYCGLLGLPEVGKPASLRGRGGLWLQVGDRQVHLGVEDGVNRRATRAHVAYVVSDLEHWRAILSARGIEILDGVPIPGCERFEFRDPFGNRVEFMQRLAPLG